MSREVTWTKGVIAVNAAHVVIDLPDVFIVEVDTISKYFDVDSTFSGGDGEHGFLLCANDFTMRKGENEEYTEVNVTGLDGPGWLCIAVAGRYTAYACWYRAPQKET